MLGRRRTQWMCPSSHHPSTSTRLALVPRRSLSPYMCKPATYEEQGSYMCSRATFIQPANLPQTCLAGRLVRTTISRYVVVGLLAEMDEFICFLWHKLNAFPPHSLFPPLPWPLALGRAVASAIARPSSCGVNLPQGCPLHLHTTCTQAQGCAAITGAIHAARPARGHLSCHPHQQSHSPCAPLLQQPPPALHPV